MSISVIGETNGLPGVDTAPPAAPGMPDSVKSAGRELYESLLAEARQAVAACADSSADLSGLPFVVDSTLRVACLSPHSPRLRSLQEAGAFAMPARDSHNRTVSVSAAPTGRC